MADIKLLTVVWKQNSPFGGYVSGDVVITYYDTTNGQFKVTKNASVITSGNQIPQTFYILGSTPDTYYKSEFTEQILICEASAKVKYTRQSGFPYLSKSLLNNHPSCDIPVVCDVKFTGLPSVTNASTATALDGAITVTATSTHGAIQYKLGSDFSYGSGQTSGTFSNLRTGTYTIYARDAVNCRATITVKVDVSVSYGVLYELQYTSADGSIHTAEILEKGYAGVPIEITAATAPVRYRLRGESEREKFVSILPGEIELAWVSQTEGEFAALYDNDPDQYRIRLTVDSSVKWIGKVLTNQIQERYVNAPYTFQVVATDGLAGLSDLAFVDDFGAKMTGELKQISVIAFILKKIGLGLNIRSGCNLFATGMSTGTSNDPLDQAYVDLDRYYLINENPTCLDVLKYILEPYGAQIIQWDNIWNIVRVEERVGTFSYRQYDSNGTYLSNSSYAPIRDVKLGTETNRLVWKDQNQMLRIMPGFGSIRVINNLGLKNNIIKNGEFKLVAAEKSDGYIDDKDIDYVVDTTGWQLINADNKPISVRYQTIDQDNVALVLASYEDNSKNYLLTNDINLKLGTTDRIIFKIRYKIQRSYEESNQIYNFYYLRVRFEVTYGGYWLTEDGNWKDSKHIIVTHLTNDQANQWIDFELNVGVPLNANNQPSIDFINGKPFNVKIYLPNANEAEFEGSSTAQALIKLKQKQTVGYPPDTKASFFDVDGTYTPSGFAGVYLFYYNLKEDTSAESLPNIIRPNDFSTAGATPNKKVWVLQHIQQYLITVRTFISLDYVSLEVLSNGEKNPENEALEQSMENKNRLPIQKEIFHSSIVNNGKTLLSFNNAIRFGSDIGTNMQVATTADNTWSAKKDYIANSADVVYAGYLRNSAGLPYEMWSRSAIDESKSLQGILMDSYSSQYNKSWRMLSGDLYSNDTNIGPINTIRETMDNNRIYIPVSIDWDAYANVYQVELLELFDIEENGASGFSKGFTVGYNA
jgi:hypothetical protein